MKNYKQI